MSVEVEEPRLVCAEEFGSPSNGSEEPKKPEENVLASPDRTTDVILEVEERELHANRAVLAHYSPVFHAMFYSNFKETSVDRVPLPGKKYDMMVTFFNLLYPRSVSAECLIDDTNLIGLLTLADEYQADKVLAMGQNYIGEQLFGCFHRFYRYSIKTSHSGQPFHGNQFRRGFPTFGHSGFSQQQTTPREVPQGKRGQQQDKKGLIEKLTLYLQACDVYRLPTHRDVIESLLLDLATCLNDITQSTHYPALPQDSKMGLLEGLCRKLDGSRVF